MRVHVESILPCHADDAWTEVQTSRLLTEIASPLIALKPAAGAKALPAKWKNLMTVGLRPFVFGLIPIGTRTITFEQVDGRRRMIQTRERDPLIRRWDHRIEVHAGRGGTCRYVDDVEVEAGVLTPLVWMFAQWFYRHRQMRWKRVARRLRRPVTTPSAMAGLA